jgi:hypothetical protein
MALQRISGFVTPFAFAKDRAKALGR